ncbi:MAG: type II toxin-antitoxin system HipA family toxin [Akkermansiaceae bacterium]|jgi:serine/threonine-protein kinase HipA|nr:type II toxin-antitoxin system HipA family toxin [Akkermansiaceae bacterium]MDP4994749.1 type II toxin-antitoxin system HipA family toxin [Akkermansiaceae bacterium]
MIDVLHILRESDHVGRLEYDRKRDSISLHYEEGWRFGSDGFPVSVSLPLVASAHEDPKVRAFLQGLLPDNDAVLSAWGKSFQVSPRNPFDLIKHVGEDCAGGLQFVRPGRLDSILSGEFDSLQELSESDLVGRLERLKARTRAIPVQIDGRFSLAGAQAKDALHLKDGKWYVPGGRIPTTHILKPQPEDLSEQALHEHFCLRLVSEIGLPTAKSEVIQVGDMSVLSVQRYDRITDPDDGKLKRLHQEDLCQALGHFPSEKYERDGGPSAADIVKLLRQESSEAEEDIDRFVMALAFNWIIYGSDAHSKNYSLIHAWGSYLRLAPIYDVASFLPYDPNPKSTKRKLSMKVGGEYRLHLIGKRSWTKWAEEAGLDSAWVGVEVNLMIEKVGEKLGEVIEEVSPHCRTDFIGKLGELIGERVEVCRELMEL